MPERHKQDHLMLRLLQAVDGARSVTQRHLANELGIALGLANMYLKRCVRKGLVKIKQVPANRYVYYLTPKGFAEKSRLTATYLTASFDFYRATSRACKEVFDGCQKNGWRKVILCGMSELCEIALVRLHESDLEMQGIYAPRFERGTFLDFPVYGDWDSVPFADAYVVTELLYARDMVAELAAKVPAERILTPDVVGIRMEPSLSA